MSNFYFFYTGPFSNWHRAKFIVDGVTFTHGEQWMMYAKATLFGDSQTAQEILAASHPRDQKALGRRVRGFDETVWKERNIQLVARGLTEKFIQNPELTEFILSTGDKELVEASPTDTVWGIGLAEFDPRVYDRSQWRGENRLGKALMIARENVRYYTAGRSMESSRESTSGSSPEL